MYNMEYIFLIKIFRYIFLAWTKNQNKKNILHILLGSSELTITYLLVTIFFSWEHVLTLHFLYLVNLKTLKIYRDVFVVSTPL